MKRIIVGAVAALLSLALGSTLLEAPAAAQDGASDACFPGTDPDYPPTGDGIDIDVDLQLFAGTLPPGLNGRLEFRGATPFLDFCGTVFSTPFTLPAATAAANGTLVFNVAVPKDFAVGARHQVVLYSEQERVGTFDICVDTSGRVLGANACGTAVLGQAKGNLARTGTDRALDIAKGAVVLLAVGGGALYVRRRLQTRATA